MHEHIPQELEKSLTYLFFFSPHKCIISPHLCEHNIEKEKYRLCNFYIVSETEKNHHYHIPMLYKKLVFLFLFCLLQQLIGICKSDID